MGTFVLDTEGIARQVYAEDRAVTLNISRPVDSIIIGMRWDPFTLSSWILGLLATTIY
jgi:hypothetical protein